MECAPPPAAAFTLTANEMKQVSAKLFGPVWIFRWMLGLMALVILDLLWSDRRASHWVDSPESRALHVLATGAIALELLGMCAILPVLVVVSRRKRRLGRPAHVVFGETRIEVVRGDDARSARTPLAAVTSLRLGAATFLIVGSGRWRNPVAVIPLRAMPDGGDAVLRYLENRTIAGLAVSRNRSR